MINRRITIRFAIKADVPMIRNFIQALADYEKLSEEMIATEKNLEDSLFGDHPQAEVLLLEDKTGVKGFALFFHNYSTFLGKRGLYLEDLFVLPQSRGNGFGKALLSELAKIALERKCGRLEWSVLDWNKPAIDFYLSVGAEPMKGWTVNRLSPEMMKILSVDGKLE